MFEIGVFEHDERIAAAKLHRRRLEVLPGAGRDAAAGGDAAGQGNALDARVLDDVVGLFVRDQKIGVEADGRARVDQQFLEGNGALRHDAGVLHQQGVARHQMRTGDPGKLVIGKVPGLDAEDHADRAALHVAFAERRMEFLVGQEMLGILGVVGEDLGAELDFSARLVDALAHLQRHGVGQILHPVVHQGGCLGDDDGALGVGLVPPGLETLLGGGDLGLELPCRSGSQTSSGVFR